MEAIWTLMGFIASFYLGAMWEARHWRRSSGEMVAALQQRISDMGVDRRLSEERIDRLTSDLLQFRRDAERIHSPGKNREARNDPPPETLMEFCAMFETGATMLYEAQEAYKGGRTWDSIEEELRENFAEVNRLK